IAGTGNDYGYAIAVNPTTQLAVITGQTASSNFPTQNPTQSSLSGTNDAFALRLASDFSQLVFGTYLGGSGTEQGNAIAQDLKYDIFVGGQTMSCNFPTSSGAYQTGLGG